MLWLAKQGYQVTGVELSPIACDAFFKEHKIHVTITNTVSPQYLPGVRFNKGRRFVSIHHILNALGEKSDLSAG